MEVCGTEKTVLILSIMSAVVKHNYAFDYF